MRARAIAAAAARPPRAERDPERDRDRATDSGHAGSERLPGDACNGGRDGHPNRDGNPDLDPDLDPDPGLDPGLDPDVDRDPAPLTSTHFAPQNNVRLTHYKYGRGVLDPLGQHFPIACDEALEQGAVHPLRVVRQQSSPHPLDDVVLDPSLCAYTCMRTSGSRKPSRSSAVAYSPRVRFGDTRT